MYFQRMTLYTGYSVQHACNMASNSKEQRPPLDPEADTPLFRAQKRVAFDLAERKLRGRRDLRADIRHTVIAGTVRAYWGTYPDKMLKEVIYGVQQDWFKPTGKRISKRTIEEAIRREKAIGSPIVAK